ncbi:hypothetical protein ACOMHN_047461 [Nucella lapillus]
MAHCKGVHTTDRAGWLWGGYNNLLSSTVSVDDMRPVWRCQRFCGGAWALCTEHSTLTQRQSGIGTQGGGPVTECRRWLRAETVRQRGLSKASSPPPLSSSPVKADRGVQRGSVQSLLTPTPQLITCEDAVWSSDVDFLFGEDRAHVSDVMGSINVSRRVANGSRVVVPTVRPPPGGWGSQHSMSLAFVIFVLGLLTFSVRYASVFWYTNKALTAVFGLQLLAMTLTGVLGYPAFACLYKVGRNQPLYLNVHLALGCGVTLALYLLGSAVMVLSTVTVFEYGAHYFAEKLRIVERKHRQNPENLVKQTLVVHSGCQGYVPHSCAMGALVALALCKGPLLYDLVNLYRPTQDGLVLTGVVVEACYMILWIALWFGLTVKQRWQFRILDYVPLGKPLFMIHDHHRVMKNPTFDGGCGDGGSHSLEMQDAPRAGRRAGSSRESPPGYLEALGSGNVTPDHDVTNSEAGTEESDPAHPNDVLADPDCLPALVTGGGARRKTRPGGRRHGGQRVTFDDSARPRDRRASSGDLRATGDAGSRHLAPSSTHIHVTADVHNNNVRSYNPAAAAAAVGHHGDGSGDTSAPGVTLRRASGAQQDGGALNREYRNSLRSKCDDLYTLVDHGHKSSSLNNLSRDMAEGGGGGGGDPLPTLMSSFRDKVRESCRSASSYRQQQQRRHLQLAHCSSLDAPARDPSPHTPTPPPGAMVNGVGGGSSTELDHRHQDGDKRRPLVGEADLGDITLRLDDSLDSGVRSSKQGSTLSDDDHNHSFQNHHHNHHHPPPPHPYPGPHYSHKAPGGSLNNSGALESDSGSLPSIRENGQLAVPAACAAPPVSDKPPRQLGSGSKMDYLSIDKGGQAYSRRLRVSVPGTKAEIGRRDSANYSLTSSQETSSNDSDHGQGLCSQV